MTILIFCGIIAFGCFERYVLLKKYILTNSYKKRKASFNSVKKYANIAIISFCVVCGVLFYFLNADYLRYRIAYAAIENVSYFNFNGSLNITTSTEGFQDISTPYEFTGAITDIAQQSMKYQINATSYVDGINSYISKYFEDGITYTSTTIKFDGVDLGTEKVKSNKISMKSFPDDSIYNYINISPLLKSEFDNIKFDKKSNMYNVTLNAEDVRSSLLNTAYDMIDNNNNLTSTEKKVKKEQYNKFFSQYYLNDISLAYGYDKLNFAKLYIYAELIVPESRDYPYERVFDIDLILNIELPSRRTDIQPPDDISEYQSFYNIYGKN